MIMRSRSLVLAMIFTLGVLAGSGCSRENPVVYKRSTLDREYTFIVGILTPDSLRTYRQEVFVGTIKPQDYPPPATLGLDSIVNRVILTMRGGYYAEVDTGKPAKVSVEDDAGKVVEFRSVGNGYYRDIDSALRVRANGRYKLRVEYDGDIYTGETTVPGDFKLTNAADGDTVIVPQGVAGGGYTTWLYGLQWTPSSGAAFYRVTSTQDYIDFWTMDHTFRPGDCALAFSFDSGRVVSATKVRIEAPDSNYAKIYRPGYSYTYSDDWEKWFKDHGDLPLSERTSIHGPGNIGGVFGSMNMVKAAFIARKKE